MIKKPTYEELEKRIQKFEQAESKHKHREEQPTHPYNLLDYIISYARSAIAVHDRNLKYIYVSKRYLEDYKVKEKNVIGKHHYEVFPNLPQKWRDVHQRALAGEVLNAEEDPYYREDGSVDWTRWECRPWYESDGSIGGIIIYTEVITDRKQVEESLRKSEQLLATHLQNTPIGAISWDMGFRVVEWNPAAKTIFGYTKEEAMGKHATELILPEDMKELVDGIFQDLVSEKGGTRSTNKNRTKGGRRILCDWYNTTLKGPEGEVIGVASLVHDITERVKAVDALKEQKRFSEKIIQTSSAIIVGLNKSHKIVLFNQGAEKITGFSSKEIIGRDWFEIFFKPDMYDEMDRVWGNAWGAKYNAYVNPIQAKNGDEKIISWQSTGMYDNADETKHMLLSIGEDITERIQAEEALRKSKEKYSSLVESTTDWIWEVDADGLYTYSNSKIRDILGYEPEGIIGKSPFDFMNAKESDRKGNIFKEIIKSQKPFEQLENTNIHKDGYLVILETSGVPIFDNNEIFLGYRGIDRDISDRKKITSLLMESEEKYRSMMESMKDASYICSSELHIEYMNPAMIDRVGKDAIGEICYKTIYGLDEKCSWCVFDQIKKGEHVDYEVADPKDSRYYSVSNSPIFNDNNVVSKMTIFHDITEIKNIEAQLQQSRKMESIGTLAGGIAHDFNNILFAISGNTEMALEDIPKWNPVHKNLEEIKSASIKATGIVKQLLNFSRKTDQKLKPIGAVTVIKDSLKFLRSTIPTTIDIHKQLPKTDITILADPVQINQVLMNLSINASQAMENTGGTLEIIVENVSLGDKEIESYPDLSSGDYLKITVRDTGPGIAPEIIDRIFDPYFTTKDMGKGSGMGLSIVHGIVRSYGGNIFVDSKLDKGTTFNVLIPIVDEKPDYEAEMIDEIPRGHETILFVDDEKSITDMIQKMLKRLGYTVETSLNPEQALDLFKSKPDAFDLVITDMTMPRMTGAKLSEKLIEIRSNIPVIICTGHSSLIDEKKAKQLGISGFAMKPISTSKIAKIIREVLDKS